MIADIKFYIKLIIRRSPLMVALFLLAVCVGVLYALRLPTTYSTDATLLVESSQIPSNMVQSTVQVDSARQLEVIQQRLMTRANLLDVARNNNVFPNQSRMNPDDVVSEMRSRTSINRTGGRDRATVMTVGFRGEDPQVITAVVNQYVTIILDASNSFRVGRAESTMDFFQQEVNNLSDQLDEQSSRILNFKNENADALPESLNFRLERQSFLQERLARADREIQSLQNQKENMRRLYEASGNVQGGPQTPQQAQLEQMRSELRNMLGVYSEQNPRVSLLRNRISSLEQEIQQQPTDEEGESLGAQRQGEPLDVALADIDSQINTLEQEQAEIDQELTRLEDSISRTPANRIALETMERNQENTRSLYNSAMERLSEARMGERIELSSQGERVTVLEPANVPNSPSGPNRAGIAGMSFIVGLGLAGGLFLLMEFLGRSIRRPSEIENSLQITPLVTIPRFESERHRQWRRIALIATTMAVIIAVPAILWAVDTYYMPLDLLFDRILERVL